MKIRNYKGRSLENIYDAIYKELGPNAIVVSQNQARGVGGLFSPHRYELIAVVDDENSDAHFLSKVSHSAELEKLTAQNREQWKRQEQLFSHFQQELKNISGNIAFSGTAGKDVPAFARHWDARFLQKVRSEMPEALHSSDGALRRQKISEILNVKENFPAKKQDGKPHIIVMVGPTGSGKTTTLAKLAAAWCLDEKLKVGCITTDTYRIAAVDQLREYATLIGLDLKVAFSAGEVSNAVQEFSGKDIILVDTPGRNHYDQMGMTGLKGMLGNFGKTTVFLTLPAVTGRSHAPEIIRSFGILKPDYIIITKIDEARKFSILTTVSVETKCPIAFITNGQRVPQDIQPARRDEIAAMITEHTGEEAVKIPA